MGVLRLPIFQEEIKIYHLRIVPPNPIFDDVVGFKKRFEAILGRQPLSKSKPHITLALFRMDPQYENQLLKILNQLSRLKTFKLNIMGFTIFDSSNTLMLKVSKPQELEQIHSLMKSLWVSELHRKPSSLKLPQTPHITISKTNGKKMLHESLKVFQHTNYFRPMVVDKLTLVSRYRSGTWDSAHHVELLP